MMFINIKVNLYYISPNIYIYSYTYFITDHDDELRKVRDESVNLGISSKIDLNATTPPPSPAEYEIIDKKINQTPPTAEPECDLSFASHIKNNEGKVNLF